MPDVDAPADAVPEVDLGATLVAAEAEAIPAAVEVEKAATKRLGPFGWFAIAWLALVATMAILPGIFPVADLDHRFREPIVEDSYGPRAGHWLGFNDSGFDMTSQVVFGTRASMIVSVGAIAFGMVVGGLLGLMAGYFRGLLDTILANTFNVLLAIPALVLALTLAAVLAPPGGDVTYFRRVFVVTLAIGLVSIPILGRITRANTLVWSEREFVLAARVLGTKSGRILRREVLPNVLPAMSSIALLSVAVAIVVEGGLALLGVGVPIDNPSWGNLIATGRSQMLLGKPWIVFAPSLLIFITVLSLNYLGDVVRARFDVRESAL